MILIRIAESNGDHLPSYLTRANGDHLPSYLTRAYMEYVLDYETDFSYSHSS